MDFARILRVAETLAHFGKAAATFRAQDDDAEAPRGFEQAPDPSRDMATGSRLFGQLEARLAGVLVSALKEAFDRDRAHLEMEREQIEHERRRADELMRLEMLRQAGEREVANIRSGVVITLVVWVTSVLVLLVHRTPGVAGTVLVAVGWAFLFAALAASFAGYRRVSGLLLRAPRDPLEAASLGRHALLLVVPWLIVAGLVCAAAGMLAALLA